VILSANINSMSISRPKSTQSKKWWALLSSKADSQQIDLINELNVEILEKEKLCIIGANGAGKTTLMRILAGIEKEYDGKVHFENKILKEPNKKIYLLHQKNTLLPWFTVKENLKFSASSDDKTIFKIAVDKFKLSQLLEVYPKTLSGGECARVALACAYIANPEILLLDEPFRGLDKLTIENCQRLLDEWLSDPTNLKAIVMVSHSIKEAIKFSSRIIIVSSRPMKITNDIDLDKVCNTEGGKPLEEIESMIETVISEALSR
jgi:NitT/TauT family transport system ATP-binding protein